jgi:hypothetical protein
MTAPRARPLGNFLCIFLGPVVWLLHLVLLYAAEGLFCMPPAATGRGTIWVGITVTAGALAALVLVAVSAPRVDGPSEHAGATFLRKATLSLALLSAVGVVWNALPLALVSACGLAAP